MASTKAKMQAAMLRPCQAVRSVAASGENRSAYVVASQCVLRYDNERGKGDHRYVGTVDAPYVFSTPDQLMADFNADIARSNHEHGRS